MADDRQGQQRAYQGQGDGRVANGTVQAQERRPADRGDELDPGQDAGWQYAPQVRRYAEASQAGAEEVEAFPWEGTTAPRRTEDRVKEQKPQAGKRKYDEAAARQKPHPQMAVSSKPECTWETACHGDSRTSSTSGLTQLLASLQQWLFSGGQTRVQEPFTGD
ncbi:hypothetical protein FHL15_006545 [Xylaria flabelliformis]|uniref:Uncharacterized protein n=1 Tax=Xylaria flabelliformis TaxID=2512241 RepID=A0A553HXE2_9PEZI|nr:hypothetical protein FHL15_006545 [Xylaria flabelliformis]